MKSRSLSQSEKKVAAAQRAQRGGRNEADKKRKNPYVKCSKCGQKVRKKDLRHHYLKEHPRRHDPANYEAVEPSGPKGGVCPRCLGWYGLRDLEEHLKTAHRYKEVGSSLWAEVEALTDMRDFPPAVHCVICESDVSRAGFWKHFLGHPKVYVDKARKKPKHVLDVAAGRVIVCSCGKALPKKQIRAHRKRCAALGQKPKWVQGGGAGG